jgi:putative ABC transport system permease protein
MLRVRNLLEKAAEILARLGFGVRLLGAFTALAGIVILAGAVASTSLRRAREVALLKTLGLTRRGVIVLFATEYALGGLTAGLVGGLGAYALAWGFLEQVLELGAELPWMALPLAGVCGALLATVAGLAASLRALAVRPVESLRA